MRKMPLKSKLSKREREVLTLMAQGFTSREIADELGLAYETVKVHNKHLRWKLGARNAPNAVLIGMRLDLL